MNCPQKYWGRDINNMIKDICQNCKKYIEDYSDCYEYRGFLFHEKCFDDGIEKVDRRRNEVIKVTQCSIRSQLDGEWQNGGYKTMKTDKSGRPITKIKEPMMLKDYEDGKL